MARELTQQILGARIRSAREDAKLTQEQLAELADMDQSAISKIEKGIRSLDTFGLLRIAKSVGRPVTWLLDVDRDLDDDEEHLLFLYRQCSDRDRATVLELARNLVKREL